MTHLVTFIIHFVKKYLTMWKTFYIIINARGRVNLPCEIAKGGFKPVYRLKTVDELYKGESTNVSGQSFGLQGLRKGVCVHRRGAGVLRRARI